MHYLDSNKKYTFSISNNTLSNCAIQLTKINKIANGTIPSNGNSCILKDLEKGKPDGIMFFASNIEIGTSIDFTFKVQVEENTKTDYVTHEEKNYTIDTQQPFKSIENNKDCFVLKAGEWYERHKIKRIIADGVNYLAGYVFPSGRLNIRDSSLNNAEISNALPAMAQNILGKVMCDKLKTISQIDQGNKNKQGIEISTTGRIGVKLDNATEETSTWTTDTANSFLQENPLTIDYALAEPYDIKCTEQQAEVLNQIYNNKIYKPVSNIFSIDNISPNMSLRYNYILPSPSFDIPY